MVHFRCCKMFFFLMIQKGLLKIIFRELRAEHSFASGMPVVYLPTSLATVDVLV